MFPALKPWLMTLAPTNEAIRCENQMKKLSLRKKIAVMIWEVTKDVRIILFSNS
jgi:hypothetical protein